MTYSGLKRAELVFTNSFWAASKIKSVAPWCADKLVVSYEGLQHETFHSHADSNEQERLKVEFGFGSGFYLWVSNFYPYKQAELLLKAYSLLNPAFRATRPMVMVGGNWGAGAAEAKAVAEKLGISKDVRFLGWVKDGWLPALYRQCGAFCLASKEETFGRSVIEAMACGAPCVVNDIPIMREVTAGHAVITDFRDGAGAAQDLRRIIEDSDLRDRISADGISRAAEFDFRRAASERIAAIRQRLYAASRFDTRNKAPILIRCEGEEKNL